MVTVKLLKGKEARQYFNDLASFRLEYFREYPYLYEGSLEYEKKYLESYFNNENSILLVALDNNKIIALSTAIPLLSEYNILEGVKETFSNMCLKLEDFYYFGEIIVLPEYRKKGIASLLYNKQEEYAKTLGYRGVCLLVVLREQDHVLKPIDYEDSDQIWIHLGYRKTSAYSYFEWPTIQPCGGSQNMSNKMVWWTKMLDNE